MATSLLYTNPVNTMPSRISDMLRQMRRQAFVGREKEIALFKNLIQPERPMRLLLHIHGPGGQGKTTLLRHLAELCGEWNLPAFVLDGRQLQAHPSAVLEALCGEIGAEQAEEIPEKLGSLGPLAVLFIDTYEKLTPLDDWFRTDFLPRLPACVRTVICSRKAPSVAWKTDPGWKRLMEEAPLRNFSLTESRAYLANQDVPEEQVQSILGFTHGHPLALSLVSDIFAHQPEKVFSPEESPGIVRALLETFLQQTPGPAHRTALEISALVHITTESVLAEAMGVESAAELFDWLRQLSFMGGNRDGLYPHDVIREALAADLRWRHPDYFQELYEKVRLYYLQRLHSANPMEQRKTLYELIFLHRLHPMVRPFFDWQESGGQWADSMQPSDAPEILDMISLFEGEGSAAAFEYWKAHPAAQVWVWRGANRKPEAFLLKINAHAIGPGEPIADPVVARAWEYCRKQHQLRSGEQVAMFRMWMVRDSYQQVSTLQSSIFLAIVQCYFTPGLAISMVSCANPRFWEQMFTYAEIRQAHEIDFSAGAMPFGWFMHDWRKQPVSDWLEMLGKRGLGGPLEEPAQKQAAEVIVLSEDAFDEAVNAALKCYHQRGELMENPLIKSQLVLRHTGTGASLPDRIACLKNLLEKELKEIEQSPADGKYCRVLYRTFFNPVGSQERAAEFLNMSFSTYRRYLKSGQERMAHGLWRQECG